MSFLNPVNEPVKRFSSTDADAPQINYNARVAGDVKTVLKACLVTGYGAKASAGWSIVNEVNHVAEFVSPNAAMSDYRLGLDDSTATKTDWYYQYNNIKTTTGSPVKNISSVNKTNPSNGWELLVSERGLLFIENVFSSAISAVGSSITYWGQIKSAIPSVTGKNIAWWCLGFNSPSPNEGRPSDFFSETFALTKRKYELEGLTVSADAHPAINIFKYYNQATGVVGISEIKLAAEWYLVASENIVGKQPAMLLQTKASAELFTGYVGTHEGRPAMYVWPIRGSSDANYLRNSSNVIVIIYLDYWEY